MDNVLPEFEVIRKDEPASTQSLTQFDVASLQCSSHDCHDVGGSGGGSLCQWVEKKQNEEQNDRKSCEYGITEGEKVRVLYASECLDNDFSNHMWHEEDSGERDKLVRGKVNNSNNTLCKGDRENDSLLYVAYLARDNQEKGENSFSFLNTLMYRHLSWKARELLDSYTLYLHDDNKNAVHPHEIMCGNSLVLRNSATRHGKGAKIDFSNNQDGLAVFCFDYCLLERSNLEIREDAEYHVSIHSFRSSEPLGIELEEVLPPAGGAKKQKLSIKRILSGSQASLDRFLEPGSAVLGVAEKPVQTIDDFVRTVDDWVKHRSHRPLNLYIQQEKCLHLKKDKNDHRNDHCGREEKLPTPMHDLSRALGSSGQSIDDNIPIILKFHNTHNVFRLRIIWLDYDSNAVIRRDLSPGESYMEKSFGTHPWVCIALDDRPIKRHPRSNSSPSVLFRVGNAMSKSRLSYGLVWDASQQTISCKIKSKTFEKERYYFNFDSETMSDSDSSNDSGINPVRVDSSYPKVAFTLIGKVLDVTKHL